MATAVGDLVVRLGAQTRQFDRKMKAAQTGVAATAASVLGLDGNLRNLDRATVKSQLSSQRFAARMQASGSIVKRSMIGPVDHLGRSLQNSTRMANGMLVALRPAGMAKVATGLRSIAVAAWGVVSAFAPLAAIGVFAAVMRSGEMFKREMKHSLAIMGDVSRGLRIDMGQAAMEAARTTEFSADKIAKGYFYLSSAGMTAQQSLVALPQVAKFAQAGMFDLARATDLATDAQSALGMKVADAQKNLANLTRVTDVLVGANTLANATVEQFSESLTSKAGAAFKIVGKDIEEAVAVLAALADQGRKGEEAGTALSRIMIGLKSNAINNAAAFARLKVEVFDANGKMRHMADIVADLENALGHLSNREQQAAIEALGFTKKTSDIIAMLLGTSEAIREYNRQLDEMAGKTAEVAANQMTAFQRGWAELTAGFSEFGSGVMTILGPVFEWLFWAFGRLVGLIGKALEGLTMVPRAMADMVSGGAFSEWLGGDTKAPIVALTDAEKNLAPAGNAAAASQRSLGSTLGAITPEIEALQGKVARFAKEMGVWVPMMERSGSAVRDLDLENSKLASTLEWMGRTLAMTNAEAQVAVLRFGTASDAMASLKDILGDTGDAMLTYQKRLKDIATWESIGALSAKEAARARRAAFAEFDQAAGGPAKQIEDLRWQMWGITNGLKDWQVELAKLSRNPFVTPEQIKELDRLRTKLDALRKAEKDREQAQKKLEQDTRSAQQRDAQRRLAIKESVETPAERAAKQRAEIERLFAPGSETRKRALAAIGGGEEGKRFSSAAERGGPEAWSRVLSAMGGGKKGPEDKTARNTEALVNQQAEANILLRDIADAQQNMTEIPP